MNLESALFDYLTSDPGVESLVDDRVYPMRVPEGAILPAISYGRTSATRTYTYDSFEDTNAFVRVRMQFNCWSSKAEEAMQVGEAVLLALSGYDGELSGQLVASAFNVLEQDMYEGETKMYRRMLDFMILYEDELTPSS
jgi:hypothetical protein